MPVNLSIKNAPDHIVASLKQRAEQHHRSLQGELLAIVEAAVADDRRITPSALLAELRALGINARSESADLIRTDRDRN